MRLRDALDLILLAAIWGASFLLMRIAAPELGPAPLIALRVAIAALLLLPLLAFRGGLKTLRDNMGRLFLLGAVNSAIPFVLYAYAATRATAGYSSILSATTPLWGALIAALWLKDRLGARALAGVALGFAGVIVLVTGKTSLAAAADPRAIAACLLAAFCYGIGGNFTKKYVTGIDPLAIAAGSQVAATIVLAPFAAAAWPAASPSSRAWLTVLALGVVCTGVAYVLYFRLIRNVGPARAMSVTYLVPLFGVAWGALLLGEPITAPMIVGMLVILAGVALTNTAKATPVAEDAVTSSGVRRPRLAVQPRPAAHGRGNASGSAAARGAA
jgi:drug/metabolite transporter (DMT)-like permease